jgi:hypothetical protein
MSTQLQLNISISINIYFRNWKGKHNGYSISENGTVNLRRLPVFRNFCAEILSEEVWNTTYVCKTIFVALAVMTSAWLLKVYGANDRNIMYGYTTYPTAVVARIL